MAEIQLTTGYNDIDKVFEDLTMYAQGFEVPTRTQEYVEVQFKGYPVPVPSLLKMGQDHTLTINADVDGELRRACLAWQAKISDPAISDGSVFTGDRRVNNKSVMRVLLLDNDMMTVTETYKLIGVKPQEVGPLAISNTGGDVATFTLSFKSLYWEIENSNNGAFVGQK